MSRTARQCVALAAMIAFATIGGSTLSVSNGLRQDERAMELNRKKLNGKKLFERETFGGNGLYVPDLP